MTFLMNRGDPSSAGTPASSHNSVPETALALRHVRRGGFRSLPLNFDAKVRHQSIDAMDLFHGHIGGMDVCARALLLADQMILDGRLAEQVAREPDIVFAPA